VLKTRALTAATGVLALLSLLVVGLPAASAQAASSERKPQTTANLRWLAHRDNPLLNGGSHEFINTDLAFSGDYAIQGNFDGFSVWDIADPAQPTLQSAVQCAGGQGDISVVGNLVIVSVDETMSNDRCDAARVPETTPHWDGIRIFDISNPQAPAYVSSIQTRCGSHTNTVVQSGKPGLVYVYVSAYSRGASTTCNGRNPLQILAVPTDNPKASSIVGEIDLFAGRSAYDSSQRVPGQANTRATSGCHDITVFGNRAAAACRGDGLYLDISDPLHPKVLSQVRDPNMTFWHSAIFTNSGKQVVFQDEMGDGMVNTCSSATSVKRGADAIWSVDGDKLLLTGYYKIPRDQPDAKRCTSHNGNVIPVADRTILVQAWYEGGISLVDMTDPASPQEIGYAVWPAYSQMHEFTAGIWSAYYYNGHIYASDMWGGLDTFELVGPQFADAARYAATSLNPQDQPQYSWVWKKEPTLPPDRSSLPALNVAPSSIAATDANSDAKTRTVHISVAAHTFTPGDRVDVWSLSPSAVIAHGTVDANGGISSLGAVLPANLAAGTYTIVVRADNAPTKLAWASVTVTSSSLPVALVVMLWVLGILVLIVAALLVRKRIRTLRRTRRRRY
jgi:hypothetical protein